MTLKTGNAFSLNSTMLILQIMDVVNGIGTTKSAWLALIIGYSMQITFVYPFLINVLHMTIMETVLLVSRDTT